MYYSFVSNSCVGLALYRLYYPWLNDYLIEYNNPFIGSLFLNDEDYVKFCENYDYYTSLEPVFGEPINKEWETYTGHKKYQHPSCDDSYLVMFLGDIEIHWIHEFNQGLLLKKYKSRLEESKKHKKIFLWSDGQIFNTPSLEKRKELLDRFNNIKDITIFLSKYENEDYVGNNTIVKFVEEWKNRTIQEINSAFIPTWGDQILISKISKDIIDKYFLRINYIIASYFGPRRRIDYNYINDRLFYLRKHLNKLKELNVEFNKIILIVNKDKYFKEEEFNYFMSDYKNIEVLIRDNISYSYGAWNDALKLYKSDFSFLIEDDYYPILDNFHYHFLKYFDNETAYVCQLYDLNFGKIHSMISNGLINNEIFEKVGGFNIYETDCFDYDMAGDNQMNFLDNLTNNGFLIKDIKDKYKISYQEIDETITYYGNINGIEIINPIIKNENDIDITLKEDERIYISSNKRMTIEVTIKDLNCKDIYYNKLDIESEIWIQPYNKSYLFGFIIEITDENKNTIIKRICSRF